MSKSEMNFEALKNKREQLFKDNSWKELLHLQKIVQKDFEILGFLSDEVFDNVLKYSLKNQPAKLDKIKAFSPKALLTDLTHCYYRIYHPDENIQTKIKLNILNSFPWIGLQVSSMIMGLHKPEEYAYLDSAVFHELFENDKKSLSINDYLHFNEKIKDLSSQLELNMLQTVFLLQDKQS